MSIKLLGEQYDELEQTHTATIEKHREVVESLNQQLLQQDLDHTNEVELLEKTHENVIKKLNIEHENEIETLKTQQASIVSGLNSEITNLKDAVVSITEERDGFKFDKEQLEIELAKAKQAIIDMERKHKEELEKRDEEKASFEQTIKDLKEEKIEADEAIKLLTESNSKLIEEVNQHIDSYNKLRAKMLS
jgi:chromosome segregation ATPase